MPKIEDRWLSTNGTSFPIIALQSWVCLFFLTLQVSISTIIIIAAYSNLNRCSRLHKRCKINKRYNNFLFLVLTFHFHNLQLYGKTLCAIHAKLRHCHMSDVGKRLLCALITHTFIFLLILLHSLSVFHTISTSVYLLNTRE